jgi:pantoate kinase
MVGTAVAFCPGHISGYFMRVAGEGYATTGSTGAGVAITDGVIARAVSAAATTVTIHRRDRAGAVIDSITGSPPVEYILEKLQVQAAITTECRLPIGAGFGLSAAALLSSITAVNSLYSLGLSEDEIAELAHESEVVHQSGLGDVAGCRGGGLACRKGPGIHAEIVRSFSTTEPLYAMSLGPLPTASVLSSPETMEKVAAAFPGRCPEDMEDFIMLSRSFAEKSGLISAPVAEVLRHCDDAGVPASMTMLGNGVFASGADAAGLLAGFGEVFELTIARHGAVLLEER